MLSEESCLFRDKSNELERISRKESIELGKLREERERLDADLRELLREHNKMIGTMEEINKFNCKLEDDLNLKKQDFIEQENEMRRLKSQLYSLRREIEDGKEKLESMENTIEFKEGERRKNMLEIIYHKDEKLILYKILQKCQFKGESLSLLISSIRQKFKCGLDKANIEDSLCGLRKELRKLQKFSDASQDLKESLKMEISKLEALSEDYDENIKEKGMMIERAVAGLVPNDEMDFVKSARGRTIEEIEDELESQMNIDD